MSWKTTMTKQGLDVLAGLNGQSVAVVGAWSGAGTVDPDLLYEQTELVQPMSPMAIIEDNAVNNQRDLRLQLSSANVDTGFKLTQIGVYISVNGGEPLLYFIAQNDDGDGIPSKHTTSSFIAEYLMSLIFAYGSDVTIEAVETAVITPDALETRLLHFKTDLMAEITNTGQTKITVSESEPENWQTDEWWYKTSYKKSSDL